MARSAAQFQRTLAERPDEQEVLFAIARIEPVAVGMVADLIDWVEEQTSLLGC